MFSSFATVSQDISKTGFGMHRPCAITLALGPIYSLRLPQEMEVFSDGTFWWFCLSV
jgi:hypothetical protein